MKPIKKSVNQNRRGVILIMSMIFILIFSVLAIGLSTMSSSNLEIAGNYSKANQAYTSATSGIETLQYWLKHADIDMPYDVPPQERFIWVAYLLWHDMEHENGINIDVSSNSVVLENFPLNSMLGESFTAVVQPEPNNIDMLQVNATGFAGQIDRTIRVNYIYGTRAHSVFNYGVATKGPLSLIGNIEMSGTNVSVDSSVYIESENVNEALSIIGNSQIAGDVNITNPDAYVTLQGGQAGIGGETGQDAIDNHVSIGVPPTEFPVPIPSYFEHYVQSIYDPNNILTEYENVKIPAGTNPSFAGGITFKGIVYIEVPNIVTFTGHVTITGIIVADGELDDNSGTNHIDFLGTVDSYPVTDLPLPEDAPQFAGLRDETGTFLMAPGFSVSFGGDFETLNGSIAANGIEFFGNAGGTIEGSVLNYSNTPMTLAGNSDLFFNRTANGEVPAGFGPEIVLHYVPNSYSEIN